MTAMLAGRRKPLGRVLVFEDDFDGVALSDKWGATFRSNNPNNEEQVYTARSTNVRVEDSTLILQSHREAYLGKEWTSGRVDTNDRHEFHYGRLEARMRLPHGKGLWPAFWTLGATAANQIDENGVSTWTGQPWPACGEIDIMESVNSSNQSLSALHYGTSVSHYYTGPIDRREWHVYAVEWTRRTLEFYVDDALHWTYNIEDIPAYQRPHFLILNLAVGGNLPGATDETTPASAQVIVDWVRVYAPEGARAAVVPTGVILSTSAVTVAVGAQVIITPSITPSSAHDKGISWTSSDDAVAIVGGGYVTGVSPGVATITATTWNGHERSCTVTVTAP